MKKHRHIDELSLTKIDYAVAKAQGWQIGDAGGQAKGYDAWCIGNIALHLKHSYRPTTNKEQCMDLIINQRIESETFFIDNKQLWRCTAYYLGRYISVDENLLIAACKAFLLSRHYNGMIEVQDELLVDNS
jgi:hypothetical protein